MIPIHNASMYRHWKKLPRAHALRTREAVGGSAQEKRSQNASHCLSPDPLGFRVRITRGRIRMSPPLLSQTRTRSHLALQSITEGIVGLHSWDDAKAEGFERTINTFPCDFSHPDIVPMVRGMIVAASPTVRHGGLPSMVISLRPSSPLFTTSNGHKYSQDR